MKKTYLSPDIELLLAATEDMIAASPNNFNGDLDNDNPIDPGDMLSRRRSGWDDEVVDDEF
jgi:hypothetical protein